MNCLAERLAEESLHSTSKQDRAFHHHLAIRDASRHLPLLRKLAAAKFPSTPVSKLLILIDYTKVPETYSVKPIENHHIPSFDINAAVARTHALIDKVKNHPDDYSAIESTICGGRMHILVTTLVSARFWNGDRDISVLSDGEDEHREEDETPDTIVDDVGVAMDRVALGHILMSMGEAAFTSAL
jgi:hypothetical protein